MTGGADLESPKTGHVSVRTALPTGNVHVARHVAPVSQPASEARVPNPQPAYGHVPTSCVPLAVRGPLSSCCGPPRDARARRRKQCHHCTGGEASWDARTFFTATHRSRSTPLPRNDPRSTFYPAAGGTRPDGPRMGVQGNHAAQGVFIRSAHTHSTRGQGGRGALRCNAPILRLRKIAPAASHPRARL